MKKLLVICVLLFVSIAVFAAPHNYIFVSLTGDPGVKDVKLDNIKDEKVNQLFAELGIEPKKINLNELLTKAGNNGYKIISIYNFNGIGTDIVFEKE
jgi:hypothetical protein